MPCRSVTRTHKECTRLQVDKLADSCIGAPCCCVRSVAVSPHPQMLAAAAGRHSCCHACSAQKWRYAAQQSRWHVTSAGLLGLRMDELNFLLHFYCNVADHAPPQRCLFLANVTTLRVGGPMCCCATATVPALMLTLPERLWSAAAVQLLHLCQRFLQAQLASSVRVCSCAAAAEGCGTCQAGFCDNTHD